MAFTDKFSIVSGPSKWDLMQALFERKDERTITIRGRSPLPDSLNIRVTCVQAHDDSGDAWDVEGWVADATIHDRRMPARQSFAPEIGQRVIVNLRSDRGACSIQFFEHRAAATMAELDEILRQKREGCFVTKAPIRI